MRDHVAVIDPGTRTPELDCFNRMSRRSPLPLTYHLPALFGLDSLTRAEAGLRGVVILGSGASVNEDHPWQDALREWLRPRLGAVPMLGLCYGHQLLAQVLGGRVGFLFEDRHKLKGLRVVPLRANPLWGEACAGPLVISHREAVLEVPPDCEVVGSTPDCAVDALAHTRWPIWSFQPHPEATLAFVANNGVPFEAPEETLAFGHGLVDAFLDRVGGSVARP